MNIKKIFISTVFAAVGFPIMVSAECPYDPNCLDNPYGAGSPYKSDGLKNPYSEYGSPYSNKSHTNPYATDAPKLYDSEGNYRGRLSIIPTILIPLRTPTVDMEVNIRQTVLIIHTEQVIHIRMPPFMSSRLSSLPN
ncbi:hypothetical protein J0667_21675 [Methylomonas sp. WH-1]|uniref:hypothetical protein n=1 Tax=unclassified Methylomonas TaxID=2608980 RepID=UPI00191D5F57|nr:MULTISPECIES: hypothetical protein [unclassified Methylomonas]